MTQPTKQAIVTADAPKPMGPYSQGIVTGQLLFTAGFGPLVPGTGEMPAGITEQTRLVLRNIAAVLAQRGATLDDVVKATVHLADLADFDQFTAAYREFFTEPYPVRTTVGSQLPGILVEIDVVAVIPEG